jgi:tartrate-resistant acid phosphatase type 5
LACLQRFSAFKDSRLGLPRSVLIVTLAIGTIAVLSCRNQPAPSSDTAGPPTAPVASGAAQTAPTTRAQLTFDRGDFLGAMNRLHQFYASAEGLKRPNGLSIDGAPDFLGIAAWVFDVYLACRSAGQSADAAWSEVVAQITQSEEWRLKHPGETSRQPLGCTATVQLDRAEFLQAMQRLHVFYRAPNGLQRPGGLSIDSAPDFLGIAAWVFDVYLNARFGGAAVDAAWTLVVQNIEASEEWRAKHPDPSATVRFAVIGDYGIAGPPARDVSLLVKSWKVDFVVTTGDNNYMTGAASTIDANVGQYYADFIVPYLGMFPATPGSGNRFFPTLGNHDWETAGAKPYLDYFTLPGNERYYDVVHYPVHVFALDSDPHEPDGRSPASLQAQWLQGRLAASTLPFRIVVLHHAPFSSGPNGSDATLQWPYGSWGASAVLAGHDHTYERIVRDGLPYVVNGTGGYDLYAFGPPVAGSTVRFNADFGAMLVEADRKGAVFTFITRTGVVVDSFKVAPYERP